MLNFGKSVNKILIPDLSQQAVLKSVVDAGQNYLAQQNYDMMESLDFYYNQNLDKHIEQWFASESLSQVPPFLGTCVPRFAKARMMIYRDSAKRLLGGEINDDYNQLAYRLNSKVRELSELAWLLGCCHFKSHYNERKNRLEYEILPNVQEYYVTGETEPFAYSYEIESVDPTRKRFVFWSEERDGVEGMHFEYDEKGSRYAIGNNSEMINPYGIAPISKVMFNRASYDVTRVSMHIMIAMTEIALSIRFKLGQPVFTGLEDGQSKLSAGIDNAYLLPEGASFQYVSPAGSLVEMIEGVKSMANQVAENNQLRIRWGESGGNVPSGEALRIMEIENLETRKSDIPVFREFEQQRYEIDRRILEVHNIVNLPEEYSVDFGEISFPLSPREEREMLSWKLDNNIISQKDLLLYYNSDMTDEELEMKLSGIMEENQTVANSQQPQSAFQRILNNVNATNN